LTSITIPEEISIGVNVFYNCISLAKVYYGSSSEKWENIFEGEGADYLTSATIYYYSETEPVEEGNYWHYDTDGATPVVWQ
jgi:hypothetical protein